MDIKEALNVLAIDDIGALDNRKLKQIYKMLMVKYHPDNNGGNDSKAKDITEAYNIVAEVIKRVKLFNKNTHEAITITTVIPLYKLIEIYDGNSIKLKNDNSEIEINKKNMLKHNILILSSVNITYHNTNYYFSNIEKKNTSDLYNIFCDIPVEELDTELYLNIKIEGKDKQVKFTSHKLKIRFTLNNGVYVELTIAKKLI